MKDADEALPDAVQDLRIGLYGLSRVNLGSDAYGSHRRGIENLPCALEGGNGDHFVLGMREPVRVDDRGVGRVGRLDGDVPARVGCDRSRRYTGVVVAVCWLFARGKIAEESRCDEVLDVRPVR